MANKNLLKGYKPFTGVNTPFRQTWNIIKWRNVAMNKMVELLHIQLIRKGRPIHYEPFYHPMYGEVYSIALFNIKSESRAPYNYYSYHDLGLNQLFVNQSPYKWYDGDPGDENGIYHDTCEIRRKVDNATSTRYGYKDLSVIKQWGQGEMIHTLHPVFNPFKDRAYIYRFPVKAKISVKFEWGKKIYLTDGKTIDKRNSRIQANRNIKIDMERWRINLDGSREKLADLSGLNFQDVLFGTQVYGSYIPKGETLLPVIDMSKIDIFQRLPIFYKELKESRVYTYDEMVGLMGKTLEFELELSGEDDFGDIYVGGKYAGRIVAFGRADIYFVDGYAKYNFPQADIGYLDDGKIVVSHTLTRKVKLSEGTNTAPIYIDVDYNALTVIHTFDPNTHMPLCGAYKFVNEWDSYYTLFVQEDQELWEKLLPVAVIIIVVIVTIITFGTMTAQVSSTGAAAVAGATAAAGSAAAGSAAAGSAAAGFFASSASALAAIGITTAAGTLALSSLFLSALGYGLSYAGAKHGKIALIKAGAIASYAGAAMGVASIATGISTALSAATAEAVANSSGCYITQGLLSSGSTASGASATSMINSGMSITTNLGVTTVNSGMGIVSLHAGNSSVLFVNGVAMSGSGVIGSMAAQFGLSMTTTTQLLSLSNIATTAYSIGNNMYNSFNRVSDVISSLRGEPVDPDIPTNQSDEESLASGNGAMGVSPSVVMRFERDIMPPDLGLDQNSLIFVRSLLKAYIHDKGNLPQLVDNIIQTRLKKRFAPLIPANV